MVAELGSARDGVFAGGLPYLAMGSGEPLVYLSGGAPNHRNPPPEFQRQLTLRTIRPFARAGFEVFFTSRWPGMSIDITWPEVAAGHAKALTGRFAAEQLAGPMLHRRWLSAVLRPPARIASRWIRVESPTDTMAKFVADVVAFLKNQVGT